MKKAFQFTGVILAALCIYLSACTKNQEQVNGSIIVKDTLPVSPRP